MDQYSRLHATHLGSLFEVDPRDGCLDACLAAVLDAFALNLPACLRACMLDLRTDD